MTTLFVQSPQIPLSITWEKLPADFVLPDFPEEIGFVAVSGSRLVVFGYRGVRLA